MLRFLRVSSAVVLVLAGGTALGVGGGDLAIMTYHSRVWQLAIFVAGLQWMIFFYGAKLASFHVARPLTEPVRWWTNYRGPIFVSLCRGGEIAYIASVTFVINSLMHHALWLGCLVGFAAAIISMVVLGEALDADDVFPDHHP